MLIQLIQHDNTLFKDFRYFSLRFAFTVYVSMIARSSAVCKYAILFTLDSATGKLLLPVPGCKRWLQAEWAARRNTQNALHWAVPEILPIV